MITLEEARRKILAAASPLPVEWVALGESVGRVLGEAITAKRTQPPYDVSSMDGYAVNGSETRFKVIGSSAAGHAFTGSLKTGEAIRIFTGAKVPETATAIIMQEDVLKDGEFITCTLPQKGKYIRKRGMDFLEGESQIEKGVEITPHLLGLAAAFDYAALPCFKAPRVAVLSTGDELAEAGSHASKDKIISTNAHVIAALAHKQGAKVIDYGIAPDNFDTLSKQVEVILNDQPDIFITSGGASVGDHDLVQKVLVAKGMTLDFWKIAMRPGKPLIFGKIGKTHFLGLPGNPVSSYVCTFIFLLPLIDKLMGKGVEEIDYQEGVLTHSLKQNDNRAEFMRGRAWQENGVWQCETFQNQDSSLLSVLAKANALIYRPIEDKARNEGESVKFVKL